MTGVPTFPIPSLAVYLLISQAVILPSQAGLEWDVAVCPLRLLVAASHYCHVAEVFMTFVQAQQLDFGSIPGTSTNVTLKLLQVFSGVSGCCQTLRDACFSWLPFSKA